MFSSRSPGHASWSSGRLMGCSAAQDREFCWIHRGGVQYYETGSSSGQFVLFVDPYLEVVHSFGRTASGPAFFCTRVYEPSNQRQAHPSRRELCFWWSWHSWLHGLCFSKQRYYCLLVLLPLEYRKFTKLNLHEFLIFSALLGFWSLAFLHLMESWTVCSQSLSLKSLEFSLPHLGSLSCLLSLWSFWWGSKPVTGCRSIVSQCGSRLRISRTLLSKSCKSWVHPPVPHWSKTLFSLSPWEQMTISTIILWLHLQHHASTTHKIFRTCSSALSNNSCSSVPETLESWHSSCLLSLEPYHTTVVPSSSSSSHSMWFFFFVLPLIFQIWFFSSLWLCLWFQGFCRCW